MKRSLSAMAAILLVGALASTAMAQTPTEITNFNRYLDNHPAVAQQLAANPSLANNQQFLGNHPGLQNFLNSHPGVSSSLRTTPGQFMYREGHYEWAQGGGPVAAAPGTASGPVARFDNGYLDQHPEVAHQLASNPKLADNPQFLATHPGLDSYLAGHPEVRQELQAHPERFMTSEWRDDLYGHGTGAPGPVGRFDRGYLDEHPEVAQQLANNPHLADNPQFLATHPGLDSYLAAHPEVRTELQQHPERFMNREAGYERSAGQPHPLSSTDNYMDHHPEVAQQLEKNPALVDNPTYLKNHPGLQDYMQNHPVARQEWKSHPYQYMKKENHWQHNHPNQ
jgi:hypothetical protein